MVQCFNAALLHDSVTECSASFVPFLLIFQFPWCHSGTNVWKKIISVGASLIYRPDSMLWDWLGVFKINLCRLQSSVMCVMWLLSNNCTQNSHVRKLTLNHCRHCCLTHICMSLQLIVQEIRRLLQRDAEYVGLKHIPVNAVSIDHFLWDYRKQHDRETNDIPFHRTRSIYY